MKEIKNILQSQEHTIVEVIKNIEIEKVQSNEDRVCSDQIETLTEEEM